METLKSVAKGFGLAVVGWIIGLVVLMPTIGWIFGFLVATVLAGGGFVVWLLLDHPEIGRAIVEESLETDLGPAAERAERREEQRQARDHIDRARRGDPRDST